MSSDIGERKNVCAEHPEIIKTLTSLLEDFVAKGRSTPGPVQQNDISNIDLWKNGKNNESNEAADKNKKTKSKKHPPS